VAWVCIEIVEGNPHLRSLLSWHLQQVGYQVHQAASLKRGSVFKASTNACHPDSELPDGDGVEFCRWLQRQQQPLILMLSAH